MQMKRGRFTRLDIQGAGTPSAWVAAGVVFLIEDGVSTGGIVQPYHGIVKDSHTGEVLYTEPFLNWNQAYGGIQAWIAARIEEDNV